MKRDALWLAGPDTARDMHDIMQLGPARIAAGTGLPPDDDDDDDEKAVQVVGHRATIDIVGPMLWAPSPWLAVFGIDHVDTAALTAEVRALARRQDVTEVALRIDTPGGHAAGTPELAAAVAALPQNVTAYCACACSAGYYVAAAADKIVAMPSALIGSVGTISAIYDDSRMLDNLGITVHVISSGPAKVGSPPSEEYLANMRQLIGSMTGKFADHVSTTRHLSAAAMTEVLGGGVYDSDAAQAWGLVDEVRPLSAAETPRMPYDAAEDNDNEDEDEDEDETGTMTIVDNHQRQTAAQQKEIAMADARLLALCAEHPALSADIIAAAEQGQAADEIVLSITQRVQEQQSAALQTRIDELQAEVEQLAQERDGQAAQLAELQAVADAPNDQGDAFVAPPPQRRSMMSESDKYRFITEHGGEAYNALPY